ncbi:cell division protein FtsB [Aquitalea magnusonii]|jgi:cell division protein FtsB|uniref:Cell division protein FtsB n=1 Tax=Aquitalea magnusonii TaxID=332411 RepID=A0A0F3KBK3_9NEIS|nr:MULTISPECIES: cell division protein FtsB [Aquitalea]KJV27489.1 cell division protein FtsB [Aquitalea magnusonii]NWK78720.1 cell division protein FtsB [Aquitalea sp. LB_tupeE]QBJ80340.1 cell division protein FtsB [Aquitalea sp. USM4]BBF86511.1 cell division protein DivIC [Aquitalea magnusonii]
MRWLTLTLVTLLIALQWPLWFGKGSWLRVWQLDKQLQEQRAVTQKLIARNAALDAEVRDLKQGTDAIEERARNELGMIRNGEVFFQLLDPATATKH